MANRNQYEDDFPRYQPDNSIQSSPEAYVDALGGHGSPPLPQRPRRRRHPLRLIAVILLLLVAGMAAYLIYIASIVAQISSVPLNASGLMSDHQGRTNILILGVGDPTHDAANLTDSMQVVSYSADLQKVAQISIPRDLRVKIAGVGYAKINSANAYGGLPLVRQTVEATLGIPVHYTVQTNFQGLKNIVDAVGGVDVQVKQRLLDREYPCDQDQYKSCGLDIQPGLQHMDGSQALKYVRCRKGTCGDDFGRAERQQEIISLLREKTLRWEVIADPRRLVPLAKALRGALTTDIGTLQLVQLARGVQSASQPTRYVISIEGGDVRGAAGSSDLVPVGGNFTAIQTRVGEIFTDDSSLAPAK